MTSEELELLKKELDLLKIEYDCGKSTSELSSFRIGGKALICIRPSSREGIVSAIRLAKKHGVRYKLIGRGSNLLFADSGYDGALILSSGCKALKKLNDTQIYAECGASLIHFSNFAMQEGLSGLEFASGIPGNVGGAVYMNAGAYGGEIKDVVSSCDVYDVSNDRIFTVSRNECEFAYRSSRFSKDRDLIILSATFELDHGERDQIRESMSAFNTSRREKQPYELPNAGSTFKRGDTYIAAKLIDDAGLKGMRVGDAQVSEKHAGFIVNLGNARACDVLTLMEKIESTVFLLYGVKLEREIEYVE